MSGHFLSEHVKLMIELAGIFLILGVVIVICGVLLARVDRIPLSHGIYLAFMAALTVGFGDVTPQSGRARTITIFLAFIGLILIGIMVAVSVHALGAAIDRV